MEWEEPLETMQGAGSATSAQQRDLSLAEAWFNAESAAHKNSQRAPGSNIIEDAEDASASCDEAPATNHERKQRSKPARRQVRRQPAMTQQRGVVVTRRTTP